jgi:hypothetical protein
VSVPASFRGIPLETFTHKFTANGECIKHPFMFLDRTPPGPPTSQPPPNSIGWICGTANSTFLSTLLPFSSFGIEAIPAAVSVQFTASATAGAGNITANGGFNYGDEPVIDSVANPPIVGGGGVLSPINWPGQARISAALALVELSNDYDDLVGFGLDNAFNYSIKLDTAPGVTLSNANTNLSLSSQVAFNGLVIRDPITGVYVKVCVPTGQLMLPLGCVSFTTICNGCISSISVPTPCFGPAQGGTCTGGNGTIGGGAVFITYTTITAPIEILVGGVPLGFDASGNAIDNASNSNSVTSTSTLTVGGTTTSGGGGGASSGFSATRSSSTTRFQIHLGKAVGTLVGGADAIPGAVMQFKLTISVGPSHNYKATVVKDELRDGLRFSATPAPTLTFRGRSIPVASQFITFDNTRISSPPDGVATLPTDGTQVVFFDVAGALRADNSSATVIAGETAVELTYFGTIQEDFTDRSVNGDRSMVAGDCLTNDATLNAQQVALANENQLLENVARAASVRTGIPTGAFNSDLFAVNGELCSTVPTPVLCTQKEFEPLTRLTYSVTYAMKTDAFRDLVVTQAFPIPIFNIARLHFPTNASGVVSSTAPANRCAGSTVPALGAMCFRDGLNTLTKVAPTFSVNTASMTWRLNYGKADFTATVPVISLLLTVNVTSTPWIDGFDVVSLEDKRENTGSVCSTTTVDFVLAKTLTPKLCVSEGVVSRLASGATTAFQSYDARFTSQTASSSFAPTVSQTLLGGLSLSALGSTNPTSIQAGDVLRIAAVVRNAGRGRAFETLVRLTRQVDSIVLGDPTNVRVFTGAGAAVSAASYSAVTGVLTIPQLAGSLSRTGADTSGANVAVILYDVTVLNTFKLNEPLALQLKASLVSYLGSPLSTENYVTTVHATGQYSAACLSSVISLTGRRPNVTADMVTGDACSTSKTSSPNAGTTVVPGEEVRYRVNVTLPTGTLDNAAVAFRIVSTAAAAQWNILNATVVSLAPATATTSPATVTSTSTTRTFAFGTLALPASAAASASNVLIIEVWFRFDTTTLAADTSVRLESDFSYTNPSTVTVSPAAITFFLRRQSLTVTTTGPTNAVAGDAIDEGDTLKYCYAVTRVQTSACAYDSTISIPIPSQLTLVPGSPVITSGGMTLTSATTPAATRTVGAAQIDVAIPLINTNTPIEICYDVIYTNAQVGTTVTTNATACTDSTPSATTGQQVCGSATIAVTPALGAGLTTSSSDPCTSGPLNARIAENVTAVMSANFPAGTTPNGAVELRWSVPGALSVLSHRIIAVGACITAPSNAATTVGTVTAATGVVRWSFGNVVRAVNLVDAACGTITVEAVFRVLDTANTGFSITGASLGGTSIVSVDTDTYTIRQPAVVVTTTTNATSGDAGDIVRICFTAQNTGTDVCAYNTVISVPAPAGFSGTLTGTFPTINPGATTAQTCANFVVLPDADTNLCRSFVPTGQLGTDADFAIGRETATTNAATPQFCIAAPSATARLTATGDSCTQSALNTPTIADVQVGETITYGITVRLVEGETLALTPRLAFAANTAIVAGSARVESVGSRVTAGAPTITADASGVSWAFGAVTNSGDNSAPDTSDEIVLSVVVRVGNAATGTLTPTVTVASTGATSPVTVATTTGLQAEVVRPALSRSSTATPTSGAFGDSVRFGFALSHASTSSGCANGVLVCETVTDMSFDPATVVITGITPAPAVTTTATGFCFTVPLLTTGETVSVTYNATFVDLPVGDRCVAGNATYTTAPANGLTPALVAPSSVCVRQVLLESLGDLVWLDLNGDGQQNNVGAVGGETPIVGAPVRLRLQSTGALVATVNTDASGRYIFDRRQHGVQANVLYTIDVDTRPGLHPALANTVTDAIDSDGVQTGSLVVIRDARVAAASQNLTFDFGFAAPISIGDFVWRDLNNDGVQNDGAASALSGIVVQLLASNGTVLGTTATDMSGLYSFSSLTTNGLVPGGAYQIVVALNTQPLLATTVGGRATFLVPTLTAAGGNAATDNNAALSGNGNNAQFSFTLPNNWNNTELRLDVGLTNPPRLGVQIGNFVFLDNNSNGVQDGTDTPLVGVQVQLLDSAGATIASTTTGAGGIYTFSSATTSALLSQTAFTLSLPTGQPILAGRLVTPANQGGDDALDSDAVLDSATGRINIAITTPIDGQSDFTFDFGVRQVAIGGDVWRDADGAGDNDGGEPRLGAVLVTLYDATGTTPLATTLTAADGTYLFSSDAFPAVRPGTTYVIGVTLPTGTQPTLADAVAGNDVIDSDGRIRTGSTTEVLSSAVVAPLTGTNTDTDFGLVSRFSIGNFVWHDVNGDGDQDSGRRRPRRRHGRPSQRRGRGRAHRDRRRRPLLVRLVAARQARCRRRRAGSRSRST